MLIDSHLPTLPTDLSPYYFLCSRTGKGDLVGSDINVHLVATSNGQMTATTNSAGQDVVVRSSSDIKVGSSPY